jgi:proteasome regulatory subunit
MSLDERALVMEMCEDPGIEYEMIGGLAEQIQDVRETVELPLTSPELFESVGVEPPRGVLLYGEPGTGKTLLAKAVAHHASATFIKMMSSSLHGRKPRRSSLSMRSTLLAQGARTMGRSGQAR